MPLFPTRSFLISFEAKNTNLNTREKSRRFRFMKKSNFFRGTFFAINVCIVDVKKYKNKEKEKKKIIKWENIIMNAFLSLFGAGKNRWTFTKRTRALLTLVFRFNKKEKNKAGRMQKPSFTLCVRMKWNDNLYHSWNGTFCKWCEQRILRSFRCFNFDSSLTRFKNKGCQR